MGELLEETKGDLSQAIAARVLPAEREKAAKEKELSAEALYAAEEDAYIAMLQAERAHAAGSKPEKPELKAAWDKARRAYDRAVRLRKAAGLPELPKFP